MDSSAASTWTSSYVSLAQQFHLGSLDDTQIILALAESFLYLDICEADVILEFYNLLMKAMFI